MIAMLPLPFPAGPRRLMFDVREVSSGYDRRRFVRSAARLYRNDRYWAPGIVAERRRTLDAKRNPALARMPLGLFVAESRASDEIIGTIAVWADGCADPAHLGGRRAAFGMFEAVNEGEVVAGLLEAAEAWAVERLPGAGGLRGPLELDPCRSPGLLVDGYNRKPAALMPYNPPYYAELVEQAGYEPAGELLAYCLDLAAGPELLSPGAAALRAEAAAICARRDLIVREITGESAWQAIPPAAQGEAAARWRPGPEAPDITADELRGHLQRIAGWHPPAIALAAQARETGEIVAFEVALPNLRGFALAARAGRIIRGWLGRARRAEAARAKAETVSRAAGRAGIRLMPAIVRADRLDWGLEALFLPELLALAARRGYASAEISPVPADDAAMNRTLASLGAAPCKAYRIYEKRL